MTHCPNCGNDLPLGAAEDGECSACSTHNTVSGEFLQPISFPNTWICEPSAIHPETLSLLEKVNLSGYDVSGQLGGENTLLAVEKNSGRLVAIRIFPGKRGELSLDQSRQVFCNEASVTSQIRHQGVPQVYFANTESQTPWYTTQPISGVPLSDVLAAMKAERIEALDSYPLRRLIGIVLACSQTIRAAHDAGYIHRNINPSNIIVGHYGQVFLTGWKLAAKIDEHGKIQPQNDESARFSAIASPWYTSPEQLCGKFELVNQLSDIWSLGAVLHEVCTLSTPFPGNNTDDIKRRVLDGDRVDPINANPNRHVPPQLAEMIKRCIARDQSARYDSALSLCRDLSHWLDGVAQWTTVANIDFTTLPDGHPDGWLPLWGDWVVDGGKMIIRKPGQGKESIIFLDTPVSGNVRVEITARIEAGAEGEISPIIAGPTPQNMKTKNDYYAGYCIQFGADGNTRSKFAKNGADLNRTDARYTPGKWHRVIAERSGNLLKLVVDGREVLRHRDFMPLSGSRVGFYCWGTGLQIKACKISSGGTSSAVSCLEIPNAFYNKGYIDDAKAEYLRIAESCCGHEDGLQAIFLAGKCCVEMAGRKLWTGAQPAGGQFPAEVTELLDEAWRLFEIVQKSFLGPLGYLGKGLIHEFREEYEAEAKILAEAYMKCPGYETLEAIGERLWERAFLNAMAGNHAAVMPFLTAAVKYHPDGLGTHTALMMVRFVDNRKFARDMLFGAIKLFSYDRWACANAHLAIADSYLNEGLYERAIDQCGVLLRDYPDQPVRFSAILLTGTALTRMGRLEDAIASFNHIASEPSASVEDRARAKLELATMSLCANQLDAAEQAFAKISADYTEIRGIKGAAEIGIAQCMMAKERYEQAIEKLREVETAFGDTRDVQVAAMHFAGLCQYYLGQYDAAADSFRRTVRDRTSNDSSFMLACTMAMLQQEHKAWSIIEDLASRPNRQQNMVCAARIVLAEKEMESNPAELTKSRNEILATFPQPIVQLVLEYIGEWCFCNSDIQSAIKWLTDACKHHTTKPHTRLRLKKLTSMAG